MSTLCTCPRCSAIVEKVSVSPRGLALYVGAWAVISPLLFLSAVTGPASLVFGPLAGAAGLATVTSLHGAAFPEPLCSACGASLETARSAGGSDGLRRPGSGSAVDGEARAAVTA